MGIDRIVMAGGPGERRYALFAGDEVIEFAIDRFAAQEGDIFLGRIVQRPAGLDAAFVEIGDGLPGFLPRPGKLAEGANVIVQVTAPARRGKGAALSARPTLPGRYLAYDPLRRGVVLSRQIAAPAARERLKAELALLLTGDEGVVARSRAIDAGTQDLAEELAALRDRWRTISQSAPAAPAALHRPGMLTRLLDAYPGLARIEVDDPAHLAETRRVFPDAQLVPNAWEGSGAGEFLDNALLPTVTLPGGGTLTIEETEALTVIDIDSGGRDPKETNRIALVEIARQLRLRNLAGHVLIDVIPGAGKVEMAAHLSHLAALTHPDPVPTRIIGTTRLGLVELTRERRAPSLSEIFLDPPLRAANAASLTLAGLAAATRSKAMRVTLSAAPSVIRYLQSRPALLQETMERLGRPLGLSAREGMAGFEIIEDAP